MTGGPPSQPRESLQYAPVVPRRAAVRLRRWLILSVVLLVVVVSCIFVVPWEWARYQRWHQQRTEFALWAKAGAYSAPPDQIVYEEDPAVVPSLLKDADYFRLQWYPQRPVARRVPAELLGLFKAAFKVPTAPNQSKPLLFMHELTAHEANEGPSVVTVSLESLRSGYYQGYNIAKFRFRAYTIAWTGDLGCSEDTVELLIPADTSGEDAHYRFCAGQPDPFDPSHFTIAYAANGKDGIIDGWLDRWRKLGLSVRSGPATRPTTLPAYSPERARWIVQEP